jgi:hypothetical protein
MVSQSITDIKAKLPHPDTTDQLSQFISLQKRILLDHPNPDPKLLQEIRSFVIKFCKDFLEPLDADYDFGIEAWLEKTSYTQARKNELRQIYHTISEKPSEKIREVNCFTKDEPYPEMKYHRIIFSRSDEFKVMIGPVFKAIEEVVFKLEYFVKKIPDAQRPEYIKELLGEYDEYDSDDFKSFESSFIEIIMMHIEYPMYEYMLQNVYSKDYYLKLIRNFIMNLNVCVFNEFKYMINCKRMSGEMNTSLGNGWTNLILFLFFMYKKYGIYCEIKCAIEGDDKINPKIFEGVTVEDYAKLGFTCEKQTVKGIGMASFCGMIFDPEEKINIRDPIEYLIEFFWMRRQYNGASIETHLKLFRTKALSTLYQYPGCPVIHALAKKMVKITENYKMDMNLFKDEFDRERFLNNKKYYEKHPELFTKEPSYNTRLLMYAKFKISPEDQIYLEKYIDKNLNLDGNFDFDDVFYNYVPQVAKDFYDTYSIKVSYKNSFNYQEIDLGISTDEKFDEYVKIIKRYGLSQSNFNKYKKRYLKRTKKNDLIIEPMLMYL